jgi:hypothetical protein
MQFAPSYFLSLLAPNALERVRSQVLHIHGAAFGMPAHFCRVTVEHKETRRTHLNPMVWNLGRKRGTHSTPAPA